MQKRSPEKKGGRVGSRARSQEEVWRGNGSVGNLGVRCFLNEQRGEPWGSKSAFVCLSFFLCKVRVIGPFS